MKKIIAFVCTALLLSGCGTKESSSVKPSDSEPEQTAAPTPTPTPKPTPTPTPVPTKEPKLSFDDLEIKEYSYDLYGTTEYFLVIKNLTDYTFDLSANVIAYDKENDMIGATDGEIDVLGPGETSIMPLFFMNVSGIDHIDYSGMKYTIDPYYKPVISGLSVKESQKGSNLILAVTNNNDYPAEFVEAYALFFDKKNKLIGYDSQYFTDDASEIKPNDTIIQQLTSFKKFDHVEYYFTGRAD